MGDEKTLRIRTVAVFDFDGTLTTRDTLPEFIKFACGSWQFYLGFLLYSPLLVLMKLRRYPNWKAKQKIFSYFFKGWRYSAFQDAGARFAERIETFRRDGVIAKLQEHVENGDTVYIISASIDGWVKPWCMKLGVTDVLGTKIEVIDGRVTGRFLSENCCGQEKVSRLLQVEPIREDFYLYAYGDSRGDREMMSFADKGLIIK